MEPFPTFYLRTARAYAFLETALRSTMGDAFLVSSSRMLENGERYETRLRTELEDKIAVLYGLHVVAAKSIGMRHALTPEEADAYPPDEVEARARALLSGIANDPDVGRDPRVIVPVHYDADQRVWRYWAVVGSTVLRTQTLFYPGFEPAVVALGDHCEFRSFVEHDPYIVVGKMIEVAIPDTKRPPTRDEFRKVCDQYRTPEAIAAALEAP